MCTLGESRDLLWTDFGEEGPVAVIRVKEVAEGLSRWDLGFVLKACPATSWCDRLASPKVRAGMPDIAASERRS